MKKKYYIQPEMETIQVNTLDLMIPGGGSPTDGKMDPGPDLAPKKKPF